MCCFLTAFKTFFYFIGAVKTLPIFLPNLSIYSCLTLARMCNQPRISATLKTFYYFGWRKSLSVCSPAKLSVGFQEHICLFWNFITAEQFSRFESSKKKTKDKPPKSQKTDQKTQLVADKQSPVYRLGYRPTCPTCSSHVLQFSLESFLLVQSIWISPMN